jgi:hypothetical protein
VTDQNQKAGDNSTNIQAGGSVVIQQGLTVTEARQIALDVFKGNYLTLAGEAVDVARRRAEEVTEAFLKKLQTQNPEGLKQAKEPDFQHAVFTVQKEYARCGDKDLGDLLVDLLVDRTKQPLRSILQIVLNESLAVAPKLTHDQLAALSLIFLFRYTINNGLGSFAGLDAYLARYVAPFSSVIDKKDACYQHLEYSGCGTVGIGSVALVEVFRRNYAGLFSKGFDEAQFQSKQMTIPFTHPIFVTCLHDQSRRQVNAMNEDVLKKQAASQQIVGDDLNKLIALQNEHLMAHEDIKTFIVARQPHMQRVFDIWEESNMKHFTLTSVGISIGHANIKKNLGEFTDLSIWIN